MSRAALIALLATACGGGGRTGIEIHVVADQRDTAAAFAEHIPYPALSVVESADPAGGAAAADGAIVVAAVVDGAACPECYRIEPAAGGLIVSGGAPLGLQYGLAHAFELLGFGFFQPWYTLAPAQPLVPEQHPDLGRDHAPEMARRGLHLHTIHPTEAYYAFWEPGEDRLADARRIIDWAIKARANYLQWVALDSIQLDGADPTAWQAHTAAIAAYARGRGLEVGLAIQLFGASNLQQGFDLVDDETAPVRPQVAARLPVLFDGLTWDTINLSFGEFFGQDPALFIAAIDDAYAELQAQAPGTELAATVHVGDSPDQRVDYMGESLIYYFLVKFADPGIIPWIHTVMFYNLYEDAGGAYHHDDFAEHRAYLHQRVAAGERVAYFPETAYWVAFDNSVPIYLPLYARSRWLDLAETRAALTAPLNEQVLFSSGWEWGYWQNDWAALRAAWALPERWEDLFETMFAPAGEAGRAAATQVIALTGYQHAYLIEMRLAPYLAARDTYIDVGDEIGVVSQPDRVRFEEVLALDAAGRAAFADTVLVPLQAFADSIEPVAGALATQGLDAAWHRELVDGAEVTAARAQYVAALYRAVLAQADGGDPGDDWNQAMGALARGRDAVTRRHAALHYPEPDRLLYGTTNATLYQWGYLKQTHELCYWERERIEVERLLFGSTAPIPGCVF